MLFNGRELPEEDEGIVEAEDEAEDVKDDVGEEAGDEFNVDGILAED